MYQGQTLIKILLFHMLAQKRGTRLDYLCMVCMLEKRLHKSLTVYMGIGHTIVVGQSKRLIRKRLTAQRKEDHGILH